MEPLAVLWALLATALVLLGTLLVYAHKRRAAYGA